MVNYGHAAAYSLQKAHPIKVDSTRHAHSQILTFGSDARTVIHFQVLLLKAAQNGDSTVLSVGP